MPRRTGSSQRWRQRQERDIYVEQANRAGWRSRAVFKLEQIQAKERLLHRGAVCVDLGSAPGGWSQLAAKLVGRENIIAGTDCGFGTFARSTYQVEPEIVWAKLHAMAEGARLASTALWG